MSSARDEAASHSQVLERVAEAYTFRDAPGVVRFLAAHPYLGPLLLEAREQIDRFFPSSRKPAAALVTDPESENHEQIFVSIAECATAAELLKRLRAFDESWWLDALPRARGKLLIDIDTAEIR